MKIIATKNAPGAIGPYSQGIMANNLLFISGQLGVNPENGELGKDIKEQASLSMKNLKAILSEAGLGMNNIVKTTIFLTDMANFATVNEVYASFFEGTYPARSCFAVKALPKNGLVEIEAIASAL